VGTWGCGPQLTEPSNLPPAPLANSTLRQFVHVLADAPTKAIVILGDSITDGRGSTTDVNNRRPDDLAQRLSTNAPTTGVAVINMGIGGNGVFGGLGPSAQARFDRDVLGQSRMRWLIVFEGVNDIGRGASAQSLTNAYAQFVDRAHAQNLGAYGATITPFGGNGYYTPAHEAVRQAVNAWIRTGGKFDAVIEFNVAVRNPVTLTNLLSACDTGDGLHLNPAGYRAMAESINLTLITQ
jgi:lysophospholipase L1-like esterase